MRATVSCRPMLIAAIAFGLFACVDRGDPTDPGAPKTPTPSGVITVAVRLPVTSLEVGKVVSAAATPMNDAGQAVPSAPVAWSSSDTSIVVGLERRPDERAEDGHCQYIRNERRSRWTGLPHRHR